MKSIVFIVLQIFFATRAILKIREYRSYIPQVTGEYSVTWRVACSRFSKVGDERKKSEREKQLGTSTKEGKGEAKGELFLALVLPCFFLSLSPFFPSTQPPIAWNRLRGALDQSPDNLVPGVSHLTVSWSSKGR